jgi:23S rRNA (cytosine1962-C5)-methyltransferase
MQGTVILKKGEGRSFFAGGPWIYDNEIDRIDGTITDGDSVRVCNDRGDFLAWGFYNSNSKIRVRVLSRYANDVIDEAFFEKRLRNAWDYRKKTVDTSACRIVFAEADGMPGLVIDKFNDVLVFESLSLGMDLYKKSVAESITRILAEDGIRVRGIYERSDAKVRTLEGMERVKGFLTDPFDTKVPITENCVRYIVDVENGQKTGFFLDQKYNRLAIQKLCKGARVLDCFTHTGSFALNAGIAGAAEVTGVDASDLAIAQAEENARLNRLENIVRFQVADVLELLPELERRGERYDVIILDPPAFTKSRNSVKNAVRGYRDINMRAMRLLNDGGFLATCSCSHFMTNDLFQSMLTQAANTSHRRIRQVEVRAQSPDHPYLWGADETFYLKFYILQVFREGVYGSF